MPLCEYPAPRDPEFMFPAPALPSHAKQTFLQGYICAPAARHRPGVFIACRRQHYRFCASFSSASANDEILTGWLAFCFCYLLLCWNVIYTAPLEYILKRAAIEDGSRIFVFIFIVLACFACLGAVLSIVINAAASNISQYLWLPVSIAAMIASWLLVHTIYIFHYAHLYYQDGERGSGLHFPGGERPDYRDFAYYSLCMGCTFQVSDVDTTSKKLRQVTMYHGLISFALNTFLVALTINIVSGLIH